MAHSSDQLRRDAIQIWQAGVDAVRSERLVADALHVEDRTLRIADEAIDLDSIDRIVVVGGGKGGAGMAAAFEKQLGTSLLAEKQVTGWLNVPDDCVPDDCVPDDCVRPLETIHLHAARPAGRNEPTAEGVQGTEEIVRLVRSLGANDLCLVLISGGGSALLPAPVEAITLADKLAVTQHLSAAGANIEQLNTVRKQLSRLKGGGLARACSAGRLVSLIISDVPGDPLSIIASGPTVEDESTAQEALDVLEHFNAAAAGISSRVFEYLRTKPAGRATSPRVRVSNHIIGNNATAVRAAALEAERLGYTAESSSADELEGAAETIGQRLADRAVALRDASGTNCLISGGEPVVTLVDPSVRGCGGRNQQLALAALAHLGNNIRGVAILSGGTDGEDGPTDAAGAVIDEAVYRAAMEQGLDPFDFLNRNDAYHFFEPLGALITTGPTHTNVCDLRVALVDHDSKHS